MDLDSEPHTYFKNSFFISSDKWGMFFEAVRQMDEVMKHDVRYREWRILHGIDGMEIEEDDDDV